VDPSGSADRPMPSVGSAADDSPRERPRPRGRYRTLLALAIALWALVAAGTAVSLEFTHSGETAAGSTNAGEFLTHFQQTGSAATTTPAPLPAVLSASAAAPTVLGGASTRYLVNAGVAGDQASDWTFTETVGIALNLEIELRFQVTYAVGAVTTTFAATAYVESQAAAPGATLTFTVYWDSGHATGVVLQSELEVSQACPAVGTCP